jgi:hypothetical protein
MDYSRCLSTEQRGDAEAGEARFVHVDRVIAGVPHVVRRALAVLKDNAIAGIARPVQIR